MELQAASLVFGVNIVVHQAGQPAWIIRNFPKVSAPGHPADDAHRSQMVVARDVLALRCLQDVAYPQA